MTNNNDKILKVLETIKEPINTTDLAKETGIDLRNISRYLKSLENEGLVARKTIQNGKIRVVNIALIPEKPIPEETKEIKQEKLHKPKPIETTPIPEIFNIDFNKMCIELAEDLDYQRSIIKAFRNALPQIFGGINTRVSKEAMSKEFNERVKAHFKK